MITVDLEANGGGLPIDLPAETGKWKSGRSVPSILFFNKLYYRNNLGVYINNFRDIPRAVSVILFKFKISLECTCTHVFRSLTRIGSIISFSTYDFM